MDWNWQSNNPFSEATGISIGPSDDLKRLFGWESNGDVYKREVNMANGTSEHYTPKYKDPLEGLGSKPMFYLSDPESEGLGNGKVIVSRPPLGVEPSEGFWGSLNPAKGYYNPDEGYGNYITSSGQVGLDDLGVDNLGFAWQPNSKVKWLDPKYSLGDYTFGKKGIEYSNDDGTQFKLRPNSDGWKANYSSKF